MQPFSINFPLVIDIVDRFMKLINNVLNDGGQIKYIFQIN